MILLLCFFLGGGFKIFRCNSEDDSKLEAKREIIIFRLKRSTRTKFQCVNSHWLSHPNSLLQIKMVITSFYEYEKSVMAIHGGCKRGRR